MTWFSDIFLYPLERDEWNPELLMVCWKSFQKLESQQRTPRMLLHYTWKSSELYLLLTCRSTFLSADFCSCLRSKLKQRDLPGWSNNADSNKAYLTHTHTKTKKHANIQQHMLKVNLYISTCKKKKGKKKLIYRFRNCGIL